jgi:hypothetical protein
MGFLDTLFGGAAEKGASQQDLAAIGAYGSQAQDVLKGTYGLGQQQLQQGIGAWSPLQTLAQQYQGAAPTYLGALGVGTPEQIAAAQKAFTSSPAYNYQLQQGEEALKRTQWGGGMGPTGNTDMAAIQFGQNLANQNYQNWLNNLFQAGQTGANLGMNVAQGQQTGYTNLANLGQTYGENVTNVLGNVMSGTIGANNLAAAGEAQGAKNLLGLGENLLGAATKIAVA